ncbi:hypothetical protein KQI88_05960 [Alkaliphilus sp. MSJ-5]|uniref:DUF1310 family protein n=1 Tax=Alkaliphilus flagellatus TaxID=2841507 RepID=A0ABS6G0C4_9FIRM|nr:hypothetical protein [Alkaliphilus flagellatus]MBU5675954.1 hypothetical protein [Alkaliphilus flagellatus]
MKKILTVFILIVFTIAFMGCSLNYNGNNNDETTELKSYLKKTTQEYAKKYFNKEIDLKDFDISIAEESASNQFNGLMSTEGVEDIYLIGNVKGEPKDVLEFILVYNVRTGKVTKFGMLTVNDKEMIYVDNLE